ncbi:N/A [soil metagenome]
MRILVLSNLYPPDVIGGYELACEQVADALRGNGHDVLVLTSAPRQPVDNIPHVRRTLRLTDIWNQYWMGKQAPLTQFLLDAESRLVNAFNVQALTTTLEEFDPEVVYVCNVTGLGGLGMIATLQHLEVPWVWQLGDSVPSYICSIWDKVVPALAREFGRQAKGTFVAVSSRLVEEIEGLGVPLNGRIAVLPYWIQGDRKPIQKEYLKGGRLRVVSAGRLTPYKGIDLLIEALARLVEEGFDNVELDLFGTVADVDVAYYPNLIRRFDLQDRVRLLGSRPQSELLRLYANYDVFAFPTWPREPFGLGPVEAAAHGGCVPLIAQNCGLAEWLVHGVHCLKAATTADAFAGSLRAILEGRIDLVSLARRASNVIWNDFHLDAIVPWIERLLIEAANEPRPGRAGTAAEAYRMALLAEKLSQVMITEAHCA